MYGELSFGEAGLGETLVDIAEEIDFNCFQSGGEVDLSVCRKVGFKNVQARKAWHGIFGFNTEQAGICYELSFPPGPGGCGTPPCAPSGCTHTTCNCTWEPYQASPPTNRYLDWSVSAHSLNTATGFPDVSADLNRTVSVNRWTGCQTVTACSDAYTDIGTFNALQHGISGSNIVDPCTLGIFDNMPANGAFNIFLMLTWCRPIAQSFACGGTACSTITGCEPQYTCTTTDIPSGNVINQLIVDGIAGTADYFSKTTTGLLLCEVHIAVTETTSFVQIKGYGYSGSTLISTSDFHCTNMLGNAYTSTQLYADLQILLNRIDMSDDDQYPWRTDGYVGVAPLMTFDEGAQNSPNPTNAVQTMCPITNSRCPNTGNITGDLLPAGYGPNFAWNHRTWRCCQGDSGALASYIYAYGAWAKTPPESPIPPYTFTTCPPLVCAGGQIPLLSFDNPSGTLTFKTGTLIPGWTGSEPVAICGTHAVDGIYNISPVTVTGPGPFEYSVIEPQINDAPFQPGCEGGVVGVVNINQDVTFYTAGDATDLAMPPTATQWTENRSDKFLPKTAGDFPPGGWLIFDSDYLFGQKWAEIKVHRPSYNFARPCGVDKWMLDETKVACVEDTDGLFPPTVQIYADVGLMTNDLVYLCGVTAVEGHNVPEGVYKITVIDPTHVKLTTDCTMRRIASATQSGSDVNIVMTDPMVTLQNGSAVTIVGVPGLSGSLTATVTDAADFSVPGVLSGAYSGGGYAFITGSGAFQIAPDTIDFGCGTDANGIIGKLRLSNVPGICGRLPVTSATQKGSEIVILTGTHYLAQGDSVDFDGVAGLGTNVPVVVLNATSFLVSGVLSGPYTGGGFISVTGATNYKWDDDQSKGNFLYADFEYNFRDYQQADRMCYQFHGGSYDVCGGHQSGCNECAAAAPGFTCIEVEPGVWQSDVRQFQRLENGIDRAITNFTIDELCLPFDPCNPQIMAVVPDGSPEDFPQPSVVNNFPTTFLSDWRYGSKWQGFYVQQYPDLLAQPPHRTCINCDCDDCTSNFIPSGCQQAQDDGSCQQDTCQEECLVHSGTTYYAHLPEVEALENVPVGAPAPPIGHIGFPTYTQLSTIIVDPTWPRLIAPSGTGYGSNPGASGVDPCLPAILETPWTLAINQWLCVCSKGRFSQSYLANGQSVNCV